VPLFYLIQWISKWTKLMHLHLIMMMLKLMVAMTGKLQIDSLVKEMIHLWDLW
jgi:hypothetical protein